MYNQLIMKRKIFAFFVFLFLFVFYPKASIAKTLPWWKVQSIDTMKYSRDVAREMLKKPEFDRTIDETVAKIAQTGATHVAVATPYDEEFVPFLTRWVSAARKYSLKVWFRGNFSGWEGWFGYAKISRDEHLKKTREFLEKHPDVFADGDIFTSCPECENGGPGDPRRTDDIIGHRDFLIWEYQLTKSFFEKIGKNVISNYASMNGDVARLIMDKDTTAAMDGIVTVDHYVATPEKLARDIMDYARISGGKVVLGEWGVPLPDIHGNQSSEDQAKWIEAALQKLKLSPDLAGLNYWTDRGSSTALWNTDGSAKPAVSILTSFYSPRVIQGVITDEIRKPIEGAEVKTLLHKTLTDSFGRFEIPLLDQDELQISRTDYNTAVQTVKSNQNLVVIRLQKTRESLLFKLFKVFYRFFNPF